jgi:hypothetical protein
LVESFLEDSLGFRDDGGGLFVFLDLLFELFVLFCSEGIKFIDFLIVSSEFSLFSLDDSVHDVSSGV